MLCRRSRKSTCFHDSTSSRGENSASTHPGGLGGPDGGGANPGPSARARRRARAASPNTSSFFFFHPLARQLLGCVPVPPSRFSNYAPLSSLVERPLIANGYSDTGKESARGQRLR